MTQNQINFAKVREEQRHNLATEGYSAIELSETARHNVASEGLSGRQASESERHNQATEQLNWYLAPSQIAERYGRADYYSQGALTTEAERGWLEEEHVLAREKFEEERYYNRERLINDWTKLQIDQQNADTNYRKVMNDLDNFLLSYNFELAKYQQSGYYREMAAAVKDFTQGGRNASGLVSDILSIVAKSMAMLPN